MPLLSEDLEQAFEKLNLEPPQENELTPVSGGCTTQAFRVEKNPPLFLKLFPLGEHFERMFLCEAEGLQAIEKEKIMATPRILGAEESFLLLEWVEEGAPSGKHSWQKMGEQLARLHQSPQEAWGFFEDNYIGQTPQKNTPHFSYRKETALSDWAEFFWDYRLLFVLRILEKKQMAPPELSQKMARLEPHISKLLSGSAEAPALLHGDLWSGNYLFDTNGTPYLIDPAAYWGHREADLALARLMGNFPPAFYHAYEAVYPLRPGYEKREPLYQLYHLLNHIHLEGPGYLPATEAKLRQCMSF